MINAFYRLLYIVFAKCTQLKWVKKNQVAYSYHATFKKKVIFKPFYDILLIYKLVNCLK